MVSASAATALSPRGSHPGRGLEAGRAGSPEPNRGSAGAPNQCCVDAKRPTRRSEHRFFLCTSATSLVRRRCGVGWGVRYLTHRGACGRCPRRRGVWAVDSREKGDTPGPAQPVRGWPAGARGVMGGGAAASPNPMNHVDIISPRARLLPRLPSFSLSLVSVSVDFCFPRHGVFVSASSSLEPELLSQTASLIRQPTTHT